MIHFRYSLVDENGKYYYLSPDNNVLSDYTPRYAYKAPFNWEETQVNIERRIADDMGLFRTYSLPAVFTTEMAMLLRCIYLDKGYEATATLVIEKQVEYAKGYQPFVSAEIDFTKYNDPRQGSWTLSISLLDNGIAEFLKSIENTTYEISLDDPDALSVNMDGIELRNKATWVITGGTDPDNNPTAAHIWDTFITSVESLNQLDVQSVPWKNWTTAADFYDEKWLYKASAARSITFKWDFTIDFNAIPFGSYVVNKPFIQIFKADSSGSGSNSSVFTILDLTSEDPAVFLNTVYHVVGTFTTTPVVGDRFYFSTRLTPTPDDANRINFNYGADSIVELEYFDRVPAFDIKTMRFYTVLKKLIEKASDGKYSVASNALTNISSANADYAKGYDNIPWQTVLTSGDALRGITGQVIKTTYAQLKQFLRNTWGMGVCQEDDLLRVEPMSFIFNEDNVALTFDIISKFRPYAADDLFVSTVTIGYEDQTYDLLNGKEEFNTSQQYKLPVRRATKDLKLVNSIRADMYGVEYVRYNRFLKDTTDSKFDNNVFALEIEPMPVLGKYNLLRRSGVKGGLISPDSAYNFGLSPKRCLLRNLPYVYSILPNTTDGIITFQTTDKNSAVRTSLGSPAQVINESAPIVVATDINRPQPPLFKPTYVDFECSPPGNFAMIIADNPYSAIRFLYNGNYFKGFIVSAGIKPAKNDTYVFKLLLAPDTDLTLLKKS